MLCCLYTEYLPSVEAGTQHLLAKESKFVRYNPEILECWNVQLRYCTIRERVLLRFPSGNPRPLQAGFPHQAAVEVVRVKLPHLSVPPERHNCMQ